ncbi:MAG: hypothetical protein ACREMU_09760, partial [Gemmatimonadaceae bacterium]
MNVTPRAAAGGGVTTRNWTLVAGVTLVAGAWWLRTPSVGYLAFVIAATVVMAGIAMFEPRGARGWAVASAAAVVGFAVVAAASQRDLTRIDKQWPAYRALLGERGARDFRAAIATSLDALEHNAAQALDAPAASSDAFGVLGAL